MIYFQILASFRPSLLSGTEKDLVHFLEDENEVIKEGVLHVLAKAGGAIRDQLGESSRFGLNINFKYTIYVIIIIIVY